MQAGGSSEGRLLVRMRRRAPGRPRRARVSFSAVLGSPRTQDVLQLGSDPFAPPAGLLRGDPQRGRAVVAGEDARVVGQPPDEHPRPRPSFVADDAGLAEALLDGETVRIECRCGTGHDAPPTRGLRSAPFLPATGCFISFQNHKPRQNLRELAGRRNRRDFGPGFRSGLEPSRKTSGNGRVGAAGRRPRRRMPSAPARTPPAVTVRSVGGGLPRGSP